MYVQASKPVVVPSVSGIKTIHTNIGADFIKIAVLGGR
jgi:hypothetical protein